MKRRCALISLLFFGSLLCEAQKFDSKEAFANEVKRCLFEQDHAGFEKLRWTTEIAYQHLEKATLAESQMKREKRKLDRDGEKAFIVEKQLVLKQFFDDVGYMKSADAKLKTIQRAFMTSRQHTWLKSTSSYRFDFQFNSGLVHAEIYYIQTRTGEFYVTNCRKLEGSRPGWVGPLPIQEVYAEDLSERIAATNAAIDSMLADIKVVLEWLADPNTKLNETPVRNPIKAFSITPRYLRGSDTASLRGMDLKFEMADENTKHRYRFDFDQNKMTKFDGSLICYTKSKEMGERIHREVLKMAITNFGEATKTDFVYTSDKNYYWDRPGGLLQLTLGRQGVFMAFPGKTY